MIETPEAVIGKISFVRGDGSRPLGAMAEEAASAFLSHKGRIGAVIAATFSAEERFPALSVRIHSFLGLDASAPAFDINMACSAYPYAVYLAAKLAGDTGKETLLVDGDAQLRLVDPSDHSTGSIFSDAVSACLVGVDPGRRSSWEFFSRFDGALRCPPSGPMYMDGMKVFTFVATEVSSMLRGFAAEAGEFDWFIPHQANAYMVRQLGKALGLEDRLLVLPQDMKNPGSSSIPLTMAMSGKNGRALIAGFGAGFSAAAGTVRFTAET